MTEVALTGNDQLMYLMGRWNMTKDEALRVMRQNNQDMTGVEPPSYDPENLRDDGFSYDQINQMLSPYDHDAS